jgi:hypothetical protein
MHAAQKMCTAMDITAGAFSLVALQPDWDIHPKNITRSQPSATLAAAAIPASIRQRPVITMPALYTRNATTFDREMFKLDKERFEKIDEAETTLHAAIVESLAPGTVIRTINTATPSGIASLSALQLVGLVHTLFSTPTLHTRYQHRANKLISCALCKISKISQITSLSTSTTTSRSKLQPIMHQHFQDTNFPELHSTLAPIRFSHRLMGRTKP